ncbi:MAG: hypothetical protein Ct9H300mP16_12190 [Pseudomonadota bacterium]|nr:MAG: hypothetical protein Ct9H300mP16_12190 [Pseudomonadota bacterium]
MMNARYPERIICLTEETTETLYLLGEEDRIVGISGFRSGQAGRAKKNPKSLLLPVPGSNGYWIWNPTWFWASRIFRPRLPLT